MTTKPEPRKIKRLFYDLETSPNICTVWRTGHDIDVNEDNIVKERAVICAGWKWQGEKKVNILPWDKNQNDKTLLAEFMTAINDADEIIGHNIDRFDLPWFRTRCLFHKLPTMPDYKTVDTLLIARKKFMFNSNRLDYIAKYLGIGAKIKTGFALWKAVVLDNDPKALKKMMRYCQHDVVLLEKVWERLSAVTTHVTHAGVLAGHDKWSCPSCTSENVHLNKTKITASGTTKYSFQCNDCGRYHSVGAPAFKAYQEAKKLVAVSGK